MSKASTIPVKPPRLGPSTRIFDKSIFVPLFLCAYAILIQPLLVRIETGFLVGGKWTAAQYQIINAPRVDHKIILAAITAVSILLAIRNWPKLTLPLHIICLFVWVFYAGASVLWAFKPEISSIRFFQQTMIIMSIVLPALLANRTVDMMRGVFLCFALALIVNVFFVLNQTPMIFGVEDGRSGYVGYFVFKGELGEVAAVAFLLALHELLFPGWRRVLGVIVIGIAIYLIDASASRGSLVIALAAPLLAVIILFIAKKMRTSIPILLLSVVAFYAVLSSLAGNLINRISWYMYGNYTLSGRTLIWDFVNYEIARKPLFGWGYESFWLVGPDAPSIVDAPGWIKLMPCGHSGYLDTIVTNGYVGLVFLVIFLLTTLHAIGRVAGQEPTRGWLLLSVALYVILTNFIETAWMRGYNTLWLMSLFTAAETARYCQSPLPLSKRMHRTSEKPLQVRRLPQS